MIEARTLAGMLVGGVSSYLLVLAVRRGAAGLGLVDLPNERSSHVAPTPRGGGLGILGGTAAGLLLAAPEQPGAGLWAVLVAAVAVAALGLADDIAYVAPQMRLLGQTAAAGLVVFATGPLETLPLPPPLRLPLGSSLLAWTISLVWIVAVTNFFNFMDGIDGLAGGQAVASCLGVGLVAWSADASGLALAAGGASLGFLVHNWAPARVFMGDVGSGFLGFCLATLPFLADPSRRADAVFAVATGLGLFLLDPAETLVRRAWARKELMRAHREHRYQQLVAPGEAAGRVSATLVAAGAALAALGAASFLEPSLAWPCAAAALALFAVEVRAGVARAARRGEA